MSRTKILAGNWKMNMGPREAKGWCEQIGGLLPKASSNVRRVVFPVAYCLNPELAALAAKAGVELGAQNIHWEEKGAFTGELSATVLPETGAKWALIAHSERRQFFGETDESACKRLTRAMKSSLDIIYCIGETLAEREAGRTNEILKKQTEPFFKTFSELKSAYKGTIGLAYEPVWAIGTGKTASPAQAQEAHAFIRTIVGAGMPILYGGSVTPETAPELLKLPDVDGVLVGGASLKPDAFAKILTA